jgi:hypothetical protein
MDDFVLSNLQESRNEWCSRLVNIFTPLIIEGVKSIFTESWKMCVDNDEQDKYLMTFQNLLSRVPKWNTIIVEEERRRIIERSGCNYLEDLITCVHIIQLKVLTCIRVGNKQKKIDISIPKLDHFIHKVYIHVARKVYMNVYLFENNITPLLTQKNRRELEVIIQDCIMMTIRESIPTEDIIRAYMDESMEEEEEITIEQMAEPVLTEETGQEEKESADNPSDKPVENDDELSVVPSIQNINTENVITRLSFNDTDAVLDGEDRIQSVDAPKTFERLEEISTSRALQRKLEEEEEEDEDRIKIHTDNINLGDLGIIDINGGTSIMDDIPLFDFEELL